jgi:hypothetical protein
MVSLQIESSLKPSRRRCMKKLDEEMGMVGVILSGVP